jgi:predicted phage tail protein
MQRDVYLHGELAKFGNHWSINAPKIADAIKLIDCQTQGFKKYLIEAAEAGLELAMIVNNKKIEDPLELALDNINGDVHIALMPSGSKRGWGRVILGAILFAIAIIASGGWAMGGSGWAVAQAGEMTMGMTMLASLGVNLMLMGVTELTTSAPKHNKDEEKGIFNGPENTLIQGTPVPIAYGKLLIGGKPISVNFKPSGGIGSTTTSGGGLSGLALAQMWDNTIYDWLNDMDNIAHDNWSESDF